MKRKIHDYSESEANRLARLTLIPEKYPEHLAPLIERYRFIRSLYEVGIRFYLIKED